MMKILKLIFTYSFLVLAFPAMADLNHKADHVMNSDDKVSQFRQEIGFYNVDRNINPHCIQRINLPNLRGIDPIKDWIIKDHTIDQNDDPISTSARIISLVESDNNVPVMNIIIEQFISQDSYKQAEDSFFFVPLLISSPDMPYVKGPENLGTASAMLGKQYFPDQRVFWFYKNFFIQINAGYVPDEILIAVARWIQNDIETRLQEAQDK